MAGALALSLALLAAGAVQAATAQAADSVSMFSMPREEVGQGEPRVFEGPADGITAGGDLGGVFVDVSGGPRGDEYRLEFAPPPGSELAAGLYLRAQRRAYRDFDRPGIDIFGATRGCLIVSGHFEVKDIAIVRGAVRRLWLIYEHHCMGGPKAIHGEVRIGQPDHPVLRVAPALVRWPALDRGLPSDVVPITARATAPVAVASATIGGGDADAFEIVEDGCSGRSLAADAACRVWLRFVPPRAGTLRSTLRVAATAEAADVALEGIAYGGRTGFSVTGPPGEPVSGGRKHAFDQVTADISASGTWDGVNFLSVAPQEWWTAHFDPPDGRILEPGSFAPATRFPFNGSLAGLAVNGDNRGCNELDGHFTVVEATFTTLGDLRTFGADFEQRCARAPEAMQGRFEWRSGDRTPLPPWLDGPPLPPVEPHPGRQPAPPAPPSNEPPPTAASDGAGVAAGPGPGAPLFGLGSPTSRAPSSPGRAGSSRRPRLGSLGRELRTTPGGAVRLPVSCPATYGRCRGIVRILGPASVVVGRVAVQVRGGRSTRATIQLRRSGRRLLSRGRRLQVTIRGVAQGAVGTTVRA